MNGKKATRILVLITLPLFLACAAGQEVRKTQMETARQVGEVHFQQGNYTKALRSFLEAEQLYANDPQLQNDLGLTYLQKGRFDSAIAHFKKALSLDPDFSKARNNLGVAYLRMEQWDDAIACFEKLTEDILYERPHFPLFNLGQAYFRKKEYEKAAQYYRESLKRNNQFIDALHGLARTYIAMGQSRDAVEPLEKAVSLSPKPLPQLYFDLAEAYRMDGNREGALKMYREVIAVAPKSPIAERAGKAIARILQN